MMLSSKPSGSHHRPEVSSQRLAERGAHNRFQRSEDSSKAEVALYREATDLLMRAGYPVLVVDVNCRPPEQSAAVVAEHLHTLLAMRRM
jgi:dTMP kinase